MAGIYIHIPFCRNKCHYCNFFSQASRKHSEQFIPALKKEIAMTLDYLAGEAVNTLYFGGGTPSLFKPLILQEIIEMVSPTRRRNTPPPAPSTGGKERSPAPEIMEITMELNPEDVTKEFIGELKHTSFNRFSLGVQSFIDEELKYLGRSHSASQAMVAVKQLQESGYENISIDLIYGIPSSTVNGWRMNLETAFSLQVPHISAYALTVEPKTPLAWMIERQKLVPVRNEQQADLFRILMEKTKEQGYLQYEISNFCKPGWHAIHNTNYWKGIPYLGLGPSAHSYNGTSRRWNISNLSKYIDSMDKGECLFEEETLSDKMKFNEYVMTSLRTMWGCDLEKIISELKTGADRRDAIPEASFEPIRKLVASYVQKGFLTEAAGVCFLTDEGKLFADGIASDLFLTE